jgi:chromosomal replication initiator protein
LLIVEDLQHLPARQAEALCQLLDQRRAFGQGLILTSGVPIAELRHWPRRLTSRLSSGLVVPLWSPGRQSRAHIVQAAAQRRGLPLSADMAAQLVNQPDGLRAALGRLHRLCQLSTCSAPADPQNPPTAHLAQLKDPQAGPESLWEQVLRQVCAAFAVDPHELLGPSRLGRVLLPRQVAMYLLRQAGWSLPRLAQAFGRDHATVLHACRKVNQKLQADPALHAVVRRLQAVLH